MQNEMRDRLIELIDIEYDGEPNCLLCEEASDKCQKCEHRWEYKLADRLIENGVIVPPCKVGDVVYFITYNIKTSTHNVRRGYIYKIILMENREHIVISHEGYDDEPYFDNYYGCFEDFGKTVFFTREEAEQKLKGGADDAK